MKRSGTVRSHRYTYQHEWHLNEIEIIEETLITIYVNGQELITLMGSPLNLDWLALGFLKNEGLIAGFDEVEQIRVIPNGCGVEVWLNRSFEKPEHVIVTSGCGRGVTFDNPAVEIRPFRDALRVKPEHIGIAINHLQSKDSLYARARGVHAAGLLNPEDNQLLAVAEDIGRHNSIDKVRGACLVGGIETRGCVLLTTGRISSEMLRKGALMGCPIIASRTSPTSLSVDMARAWNITLVGYVRKDGVQVYSSPERLGYNGPPPLRNG
ncbi:MAG: formate dehydrogenase accessory sulfurtransferase FdhD [Chloroflexota bacterium]|nr:formate dehydrogenase accessory sulfurtransferase FdhD [Chloroflexota bacterium]